MKKNVIVTFLKFLTSNILQSANDIITIIDENNRINKIELKISSFFTGNYPSFKQKIKITNIIFKIK